MKFRAILTCSTASLFFFYTILSLSIFNAINIDILKYYNLTTVQLSILSSGYLYANAIFLIPAGLMFDKFSTRKIMLFSMFLAVLGIYGIVLTHSVYIAFVARCLSGIASAFVILGSIRSAVMWFPGNKTSFVIGLMIAFGISGGYFSSWLYSMVIAAHDWITLFHIIGLIGVIIFLFMLVSFKDNPNHTEKLKRVNNWYLLKSAVFSKQSCLGGLYIGFMNLPVFLLGSLYGAIYLTNKYGLPNIVATQISANIFIGVMFGSPIFGFLANKYMDYKKLLYLGSFCSLFIVLVLILVPGLNILILNILFFSLGIFMASQVLIYPIIAQTNEAEIVSTAQGMASTMNNLLGALMQTLFGYIIVLFKTQSGNISHGLMIAMSIFPICFILSIIVAKYTHINSNITEPAN